MKGGREAYLDFGIGGSDEPHHHADENKEREGGGAEELPLHLFLGSPELAQGVGREAAEE